MKVYKLGGWGPFFRSWGFSLGLFPKGSWLWNMGLVDRVYAETFPVYAKYSRTTLADIFPGLHWIRDIQTPDFLDSKSAQRCKRSYFADFTSSVLIVSAGLDRDVSASNKAQFLHEVQDMLKQQKGLENFIGLNDRGELEFAIKDNKQKRRLCAYVRIWKVWNFYRTLEIYIDPRIKD